MLGYGVRTPQSSAGASRDLVSFSREKCCIALGCCSSGGGFLVPNSMRHPPASCRAVGSKLVLLQSPNIFMDV